MAAAGGGAPLLDTESGVLAPRRHGGVEHRADLGDDPLGVGVPRGVQEVIGDVHTAAR